MKNLDPYLGSAGTFFDDTIARKEDPALVARLVAAKPQLIPRYQIYDAAFAVNHLESIQPDLAFAAIGADLREVYKYNSLAMRNFVEAVGSLQPVTVRYRCQYCTVTPNESLDHYLPQSTYPEYSIHPRNLVPCCKTCNGYKSNTFLINGQRQFINYYLDQLPQVQYLFARVTVNPNGDVDFSFYLQNRNNAVPPRVFALLSTHFKKLRLFIRMHKAASTVISEFFDTIDENAERLSRQETIDEVLRLTSKNKIACGPNYYMAILKEALVADVNFMNRFNWTS
jgi:5-methylcytosine-specific restriction endonuclease McrA